MLLFVNGKENIAKAKEQIVHLGLDHQLLSLDSNPVFEIIADYSIYKPNTISQMLGEFGRVDFSKSKSPLLDNLENHSVKIKIKSGKQITFKNDAATVWIAGPCSLDQEQNLRETAKFLGALGVDVLRGGAVKPRTSPHEFQGIGRQGYKILSDIAHEFGMASISEALSEDDVEEACEYLDIIQVGARNMQNFPLLKKLGKSKRTILLKRSPGSTLREWALAAEYVLAEGNSNIVLCERGVRGMERELRYTLDFAGALFMKERYGLPIVIDPSHATGMKPILPACTAGAVAMGFAGVMLETHPNPLEAKSDALQALPFKDFAKIISIYKK